MSEKIKIALVLAALPGYSETFIWSKIEGLLNSGKDISLFINKQKKNQYLKLDIPIYSQPDTSKKYKVIMQLLRLLIQKPIRFFRFIYLENSLSIKWPNILKHLIINYHLLTQKLDWIHFEFATLGIGRENVAEVIGAKSSVSLRGFDIGLYPHKHYGCYDLLWETIDKVHTISDDLYNQALDLGLNAGVPFQKITPAIDINIFISNEKQGLHNPLRILSVGRLTWKKGFEYALKALEILKNKGINFEFTIAGEGKYREAIMFAIHQLKLTEKVTLLGTISHAEVKKQMEWADIYIQPSIQEGFCNATLEAQAMGLLCIVTNAEGLSENVINAETGWVVEKRNSELIASQIRSILSTDSYKLGKIRAASILRVKSDFNLLSQKEKWNYFYK